MTAKRVGLIFLSLWVAFLIGASLYSSWTEPQAQGRLNLYQTNLMLETLEWQPQAEDQAQLKTQLIGKDPFKDAVKQYVTVKDSIQKSLPSPTTLSDIQAATDATDNNATPVQQSNTPSANLKSLELLDFLNLRLGLLATQTNQLDQALHYWEEVQDAVFTSPEHRSNVHTAEILTGLWHEPTETAPDAQTQITETLTGWFRDQALHQLFYIEHNDTALADLQTARGLEAKSALSRLLVVVGLPAIGSLLGTILLIIWGIKSLGFSQQNSAPESPLKQNTLESSSSEDTVDAISPPSRRSPLGIDIPWPIETVWATMLFWFLAFFAVSLLVPLCLQLLGGAAILSQARGQAMLALLNYSTLIIAGLSLIYFMTRPFLESPMQWLLFRVKGKWPLWGLGGYCAALPLVLLISLVNHRILGDQGGGNPLLDIILQSHDHLTLAVLLIMVSVLAPFFEEIVFRGFVLGSLGRYFPTWVAIAASAALFAIAHLNVADFLPLMVLGCVLGTVYIQSRNLLSSMLLHSLWNGASFIGLIYLGSSQ